MSKAKAGAASRAPKAKRSPPAKRATRAKPKGTSDGAGVAIQLRVPLELAEAIDREAERLMDERAGATVHRSDVVRETVWRALMPAARTGAAKVRR